MLTQNILILRRQLSITSHRYEKVFPISLLLYYIFQYLMPQAAVSPHFEYILPLRQAEAVFLPEERKNIFSLNCYYILTLLGLRSTRIFLLYIKFKKCDIFFKIINYNTSQHLIPVFMGTDKIKEVFMHEVMISQGYFLAVIAIAILIFFIIFGRTILRMIIRKYAKRKRTIKKDISSQMED